MSAPRNSGGPDGNGFGYVLALTLVLAVATLVAVIVHAGVLQ